MLIWLIIQLINLIWLLVCHSKLVWMTHKQIIRRTGYKCLRCGVVWYFSSWENRRDYLWNPCAIKKSFIASCICHNWFEMRKRVFIGLKHPSIITSMQFRRKNLLFIRQFTWCYLNKTKQPINMNNLEKQIETWLNVITWINRKMCGTCHLITHAQHCTLMAMCIQKWNFFFYFYVAGNNTTAISKYLPSSLLPTELNKYIHLNIIFTEIFYINFQGFSHSAIITVQFHSRSVSFFGSTLTQSNHIKLATARQQ